MRRFNQPLPCERNKFGPAPRFVQSDALRAVWRLERRIGRAKLAASLGIGEGSMRTIINALSSKGLIDSAPMGHKLTHNGAAYLRRLKETTIVIRPIQSSELTFNSPAVAMQVRKPSQIPKTAILRDEAIRAGAHGCTILSFQEGKLIIPPFHAPTHRLYAHELAKIQQQFSLSEGDVILLTYGGSQHANERALWQVFSKLWCRAQR